MKYSWAAIKIRRERLFRVGFPVFLVLYIATPWRTVQFLSFFFMIIILFSRLYSEYLIRHLRLTRLDTELRGFRHEWIQTELAVTNTGLLPAFMLTIGDSPGMLTVFQGNKYLIYLPGRPRERCRRILRWQGLGSSRGLYVLGPAYIHGADPLGLFPFTLNSEETCRLFVYPTLGFISFKPPGGIPLGVLISANPFNEDLTRRKTLREYMGGDELRRINWKATARMSAGNNSCLMVNEYEDSLSYPLVVFLNIDPSEYPQKNRGLYLERSIEAAAALCVMASRERQALGLILYFSRHKAGEVISPSAFTLIPILERLAIVECPAAGNRESGQIRGSIAQLLEQGKFLPFGTRLVYIGPSLTDEDFRLLEGLKASRLSMEYVMFDEKKLPRRARQYQIKEMGYEII
jgi:uncharacterized protein (DUF58 family)